MLGEGKRRTDIAETGEYAYSYRRVQIALFSNCVKRLADVSIISQTDARRERRAAR